MTSLTVAFARCVEMAYSDVEATIRPQVTSTKAVVGVEGAWIVDVPHAVKVKKGDEQDAQNDGNLGRNSFSFRDSVGYT
jgi:hypothetical protein